MTDQMVLCVCTVNFAYVSEPRRLFAESFARLPATIADGLPELIRVGALDGKVRANRVDRQIASILRTSSS
jgi:hypothetical protein